MDHPEINNDYGKQAVQELLDGTTVFDFPKSPALMRKIIEMGAGPTGVILDYFAGSCTMAQAVLEMNTDYDGARRFIMVQLPEQTPADSEAHAAARRSRSSAGSAFGESSPSYGLRARQRSRAFVPSASPRAASVNGVARPNGRLKLSPVRWSSS